MADRIVYFAINDISPFTANISHIIPIENTDAQTINSDQCCTIVIAARTLIGSIGRGRQDMTVMIIDSPIIMNNQAGSRPQTAIYPMARGKGCRNYPLSPPVPVC